MLRLMMVENPPPFTSIPKDKGATSDNWKVNRFGVIKEGYIYSQIFT